MRARGVRSGGKACGELLPSMRVLVIGGTGFIGPWVVRQLCTAGCAVTVFHRGEHRADLPAGVREILHPGATIPILNFPPEVLAEDFEVVIHMIAMGREDAAAAVRFFATSAQRMVVLSSGDVYQVYGKFIGLEDGPADNHQLTEDAPLRSVFYPYRTRASSPEDWTYDYEKIFVEQVFMENAGRAATVLRLPKVYGSGSNSNLGTVYAFRAHPDWRWTHGYVENVAAAIVLAALHAAAGGRIYNVGEEDTPTVAQRLASLPPSTVEPAPDRNYNFAHDIVYDTTRIRHELGYREPVDYAEGIRRTLKG